MIPTARIALVIGNSDYTGSTRLPNAANDAALITRRLSKLGFQVVGGATSPNVETGITAGMNLTALPMLALIGDFMARVQPGATVVVYYAGHGLQVGGKNYLVPVDDTLDEKLPALGLVEIKPRLETLADKVGPDGTTIVFLDACRDDPVTVDQRKRLLNLLEPKTEPEFGQERSGSSLTRGGLATVKMAQNANCGRTFIGFATAPGDVAFDGPKGSHNSPFATALDQHLATRGLEIEALYNRVQCDVQDTMAAVNRYQDPWSESNLDRELYLYPRSPWPVVALGIGGLVAGLLVSMMLFDNGNLKRPPAYATWWLGGLFGIVAAAGTMRWGSRRWVDAAFAFLGPMFGFAVGLAILMMIPQFAGPVPDPKPTPESEIAKYVFGVATIVGALIYLAGVIIVRWHKQDPWPTSLLGWLHRGSIWILPGLVAGTLLALDYLLSRANPQYTATTLCALLAGILYAASAEIGCRPQQGNFRNFGPFTGAISVGLIMAVLFAAFAWLAFRLKLEGAQLQLLMVTFGAVWHMLLGMQLGYCFALYVPDHRRRRV